jgi:hypothetical protein
VSRHTFPLISKWHTTLAAEIFGVGDFWLEIRVIIKNFLDIQEPLTDFHRNKAKRKNENEKKVQNGRLKKTEFFKIANSQFFFANISEIGPYISRID